MPDSFFRHGNNVLFAEFKIMSERKSGDMVYAIRPDQRRTFAAMAEQGYLIVILAAIRATREVYALEINGYTLMGVIDLEIAKREKSAFRIDITNGSDWILDDIVLFAESAAIRCCAKKNRRSQNA